MGLGTHQFLLQTYGGGDFFGRFGSSIENTSAIINPISSENLTTFVRDIHTSRRKPSVDIEKPSVRNKEETDLRIVHDLPCDLFLACPDKPVPHLQVGSILGELGIRVRVRVRIKDGLGFGFGFG